MIFLPLFFLISTLFSAVNAAAYGGYCPSTTCGNITISYPFYHIPTTSSSIPTSCGYLGLGLTCNNANSVDPTTILTLPFNSIYIVKNINYYSRTLTLIDSNVVLTTTAESSCPRVYKNLTIGTVPLRNRNSDLDFYFNCSVANEEIPAIECLTKLGGGGMMKKKSYVFVAGREPVGVDWDGVCEEKVVAPAMVDENVENGNLVKELGEVMRLGFVLDWGLKSVECDYCEKSGGMCGLRRAEEAAAVVDEFVCYCKDGGIAALKCKQNL